MQFIVRGAWAAIAGGTAAEYRALQAWLDPLAAACGRRLLVGPRLPAGFIPIIEKAWGAAAVVQRDPTPPGVDAAAWTAIETEWELRPYQQEAARALLVAGCGIAELPPGAGKTRLAAAVMHAVPCRWLYLVGELSLAGQALREFEARGLDARAAENGTFIPSSPIVVANYQKLRGLLQDRPEALAGQFQGLIVDEVHAAAAETYADVVEAVDAQRRLGFSATPLLRADRRNPITVGLIGPVVYRKETTSLVQEGYLSPGVVRFLPYTHDLLRSGNCGAWAETYQRDITDNKARNRLIIEATLAAAPPRLVIVREVRHGIRLQEAFGYETTPLLTGEDPVANRELVFDRVRQGDVETVVVTSIGETGIDLPAVPTVVNAAAGKSALRAIQREGRGTRRAFGKVGFELIDIADLNHPWFEGHAQERARAYASGGFLVDFAGQDAAAWEPARIAPELASLEAGPARPASQEHPAPKGPPWPESWLASYKGRPWVLVRDVGLNLAWMAALVFKALQAE